MSQSLMPDSNLYQGRQMLEQLQSQSDKLILVAFVGPHCGACAALKPVLHQLVSDQKGALVLVEIDTTEEFELALAMGIYSTPTVILLKRQQVLTTLVGLQPKKRYAEAIAQFA
ncbi:thioredoxin family protein [Stenomitos frigidus]